MTFKEIRLRLRTQLSAKWLDLAGALPETERQPIHFLQELRAWERKADTPDLPSPVELQLRLPLTRFVEAYSIENFETLCDVLERLFPRLHDEDERIRTLNDSIRSLHAGSRWNLGLVVRKKNRTGYLVPVCEWPDLPEAVESIEVWLHHVLPSIVAWHSMFI
jgi:hypothetical protein